jgi:hypothetical protein
MRLFGHGTHNAPPDAGNKVCRSGRRKPALAIALQARKLLIPRLVVAALRQGEAFFLRPNKPFAGVWISDDIG